MALLNEPGVVTRKGNSVNMDTTPDLSWMAGSLEVAWRNEDVDLGSDHSIISITIKGPRFRAAFGKARITDWDRMRKHADEENETSEENAEDADIKRRQNGRESKRSRSTDLLKKS